MSVSSRVRVGVVGGEGFVGWHLACRLGVECDVVTLSRDDFSKPERAREIVQGSAFLINAAGINRGRDEEILEGHEVLGENIAQVLAGSESPRTLINLSSLHEGRQDPYGQAKARLNEVLRKATQRQGICYANIVLPNLFGEGARPFYNSVTATFCHQIANGETSKVMLGNSIELCHIQVVADVIAEMIAQGDVKDLRLSGRHTELGELYQRILDIADTYGCEGAVPDLTDDFTRNLFNTYRSHLFPARYPWKLNERKDPRGLLFEGIKSGSGGQAFVSSTVPGATRGNHYHFRKFERFLVVSGTGLIRVRRVRGTQLHGFTVSGDEPAFVDMPTLHTHSITNTGSAPLITMFWANEHFDPQRPDTVGEIV